MTVTEKAIFKTAQALIRAKLYPSYKKETNVIRVDSRKPIEIGFLVKHEFLTALQDIENKNVIKIEDFPNEQNKEEQKHFQVKLFPRFNRFYEKLAKSYPDLQNIPQSTKVISCGGLFFKPSGEFKYGEVEGRLKPGTAAWSILYFLMRNKNKFVDREILNDAIVSGWITAELNLNKTEPKSRIEDIIKLIRRKLKMGRVRGSKNKNLIKGSDNGRGYGIFCQ